MTYEITAQHTIETGFGHRSTAVEVLDGVDLTGRTAVVTGGYSGLGLETVRALTAAGAQVVVPARRPAQAEQVLAELGSDRVQIDELDLADLGSVRAFAGRYLASGRPIDLQINNAAIMASPLARVGPGWESQFATNHLGHYVLTHLLWPAISAGHDSRVISLSSTGHKLSGIRFDDPQFLTGYDKWLAYGQAKTANSLFAVHLDRLAADSGVRAFAVHPGGIMTDLQRHLPRAEMVAAGWMDEAGHVDERFKSPAQGAATSVWAATTPVLAGMGGVYCEDCNIAEPTVPGSPSARIAGVDAHAVDPHIAARLWALSAELTGVDAFG